MAESLREFSSTTSDPMCTDWTGKIGVGLAVGEVEFMARHLGRLRQQNIHGNTRRASHAMQNSVFSIVSKALARREACYTGVDTLRNQGFVVPRLRSLMQKPIVIPSSVLIKEQDKSLHNTWTLGWKADDTREDKLPAKATEQHNRLSDLAVADVPPSSPASPIVSGNPAETAANPREPVDEGERTKKLLDRPGVAFDSAFAETTLPPDDGGWAASMEANRELKAARRKVASLEAALELAVKGLAQKASGGPAGPESLDSTLDSFSALHDILSELRAGSSVDGYQTGETTPSPSPRDEPSGSLPTRCAKKLASSPRHATRSGRAPGRQASTELLAAHRRVRIFSSLLQNYLFDPSFPFVDEWVVLSPRTAATTRERMANILRSTSKSPVLRKRLLNDAKSDVTRKKLESFIRCTRDDPVEVDEVALSLGETPEAGVERITASINGILGKLWICVQSCVSVGAVDKLPVKPPGTRPHANRYQTVYEYTPSPKAQPVGGFVLGPLKNGANELASPAPHGPDDADQQLGQRNQGPPLHMFQRAARGLFAAKFLSFAQQGKQMRTTSDSASVPFGRANSSAAGAMTAKESFSVFLEGQREQLRATDRKKRAQPPQPAEGKTRRRKSAGSHSGRSTASSSGDEGTEARGKKGASSPSGGSSTSGGSQESHNAQASGRFSHRGASKKARRPFSGQLVTVTKDTRLAEQAFTARVKQTRLAFNEMAQTEWKTFSFPSRACSPYFVHQPGFASTVEQLKPAMPPPLPRGTSPDLLTHDEAKPPLQQTLEHLMQLPLHCPFDGRSNDLTPLV
ncbi:hypothetical protein DIPPA_28390 [Diplonema papillatum]|nr:hypothetical protein DIPPA_28390 [Diplonema papillatum]